MEPKSINEIGFIKDSASKQNHFLSLRKAKRINLYTKKINLDKKTDKYKLTEDSF